MTNLLKRALRIEPGISMLQWIYASGIWLWTVALPAVASGGVMSYLASITDWMSAVGPLGIGAAGLLSAQVVHIGLSHASYRRALARERIAFADAQQRWAKQVDTINPLDKEFFRKRINVNEICHPISRRVTGKKFIDCQFVGGTSITFIASEPGKLINSLTYESCDIVEVNPHCYINNVVVFENCDLLGGTIVGMAVYVQSTMLPEFVAMKANIITPINNA